MKNIILFFILLNLVACAAPKTKIPQVSSVATEIEAQKQRDMALVEWQQARFRLYRIGYPILQSGVELCGDMVRPSIGMLVWDEYAFDDVWRAAAERQYGVSDAIQIAYVVPGSPAHKAGLIAGDTILLVNGWHVPSGQNAIQQYSQHFSSVLEKRQAFPITFRRAGVQQTAMLTPTDACSYSLVMENSDEKNAYADGKKIVVYRGLMDFFKTDNEAALVISHELAHNIMEHIEAKGKNMALGGLAGLLVDAVAAAYGVNTQGQFTDIGMQVGAMSYSVEFEQEADYVSLYLMELAGYKIDNAANFWRRMAIQNPESIQMKVTHPTTAERFLNIEETVKEIKQKKNMGLPLRPDYKSEADNK